MAGARVLQYAAQALDGSHRSYKSSAQVTADLPKIIVYIAFSGSDVLARLDASVAPPYQIFPRIAEAPSMTSYLASSISLENFVLNSSSIRIVSNINQPYVQKYTI